MIKFEQLSGISGVRFAWGPSDLVDAAIDRVRSMKPGIDPEVYDAYLSSQKKLSEMPSASGGLVMAAVRVPAHRIRFSLDGHTGSALIPPTYAMTDGPLKEADAAVTRAFGQALPIRAPFKTLAVAMGLAEYGRNNLAYVDGFGSYIRLRCYLVDEKLESSSPRSHIFMRRGFDEDFLSEKCRSCGLCVGDCPTDALVEDRFTVQAGSCITHLNENPGTFPEWLERSALKCLVGCMRCQERCPMNEDKLEIVDLDSGFDDELTRHLIDGSEELNGSIQKKIFEVLEQSGIGYLSDVIKRNIKALHANGSLFKSL